MKQGTKQITTTGTINNAYIVSEFTVKCILTVKLLAKLHALCSSGLKTDQLRAHFLGGQFYFTP
jgi:hypothetical protein